MKDIKRSTFKYSISKNTPRQSYNIAQWFYLLTIQFVQHNPFESKMECFVNKYGFKIYDMIDYDGIIVPQKQESIIQLPYILHQDYFYQFYYGEYNEHQ